MILSHNICFFFFSDFFSQQAKGGRGEVITVICESTGYPFLGIFSFLFDTILV